jgi:hypothetical protein
METRRPNERLSQWPRWMVVVTRKVTTISGDSWLAGVGWERLWISPEEVKRSWPGTQKFREFLLTQKKLPHVCSGQQQAVLENCKVLFYKRALLFSRHYTSSLKYHEDGKQLYFYCTFLHFPSHFKLENFFLLVPVFGA